LFVALPSNVGGNLNLEEKIALVLTIWITQGRGYTFHSSQMYVNLGGNGRVANALVEPHCHPRAAAGLAANAPGWHQQFAVPQSLKKQTGVFQSYHSGKGGFGARIFGNVDFAPAFQFCQAHGQIKADFLSDEGQNTGQIWAKLLGHF
jgi:hypothetical protein